MPRIQHFLLTRFNLQLWHKDKSGDAVRSREWLEDRFELFEKFCLPSISNQTCKDFVWVVLFDSQTPDSFKKRIVEFQKWCQQLIPIFVEPVEGRHFGRIFRKAVLDQSDGGRVITTYLDNDDALDIHFVEDLRMRAKDLADGTFVFYSEGYQFFTEFGLLMRIQYRQNHFVSVIESGEPDVTKTVFGYGSHYYIDKIPGARIKYVKDVPLWCEVIHRRNMGNDAYFLFGTKMVQDGETLRRDFAVGETSRSGIYLYLSRFVPRYIVVFFRRIRYFFFGRKW